MMTRDPSYYRDLLEGILQEDPETIKLMRKKAAERQIKMLLSGKSNITVPHWMRYIGYPDYFTTISNEDGPLTRGKPGEDERAFNLVLPINDVKNNIKDIVLLVDVFADNKRFDTGWFFVQLIEHIPNKQYNAFREGKAFSSALNRHLSQILSANITDVTAPMGGAVDTNCSEMESKELSVAVEQQLKPICDILIYGDDEVYQALKRKAAR